MSVLSKFISEERLTTLNDILTMSCTHVSCYEVAHVWQPSCIVNAFEFTRDVFLICCGLYTPLFVGTQMVLARKFDKNTIVNTGSSILRSSAFIANHVWLFYLLICGSKKLFGKWYFLLHAFPVTFSISYLSMFIERKSRRGPLALYVLNIGTECLMNILADKGYLPKIPYASTVVFTISMALLLRHIKREGYGSDPVSFALRLVIGTSEAKKRRSRRRQLESSSTRNENNNNTLSNENQQVIQPMSPSERARHDRRNSRLDVNFNELIPKSIRPSLFNDSKHESCRHHEPCSEYVAMGFIRPFVAAWIGSSMFSLAKKVLKIRSDPSIILSSLADTRSLRFGMFIGSFAGVYKAVNCYLRWRYNESADWHAAVGGALAGPTMLFYPNSTITQYFFWKLIENYFVKASKAGYIKRPDEWVKTTYAISVSIIAYCVMLQPKYMRPSYMRFADLVSGHKFHLINRCFVSFLVPEAIEGYENYFANLHPDLVTSKFNETVMTWLLEAKDYARRDYA